MSPARRLLLISACLGPAFAQGDGPKEADAYVKFHTSPTASITHENTVGESNQSAPIPVHFTNGVARVIITRPGYFKQALTIDRSDVSEAGDYPANGTLLLQPEHFWIPVTDWLSHNRAVGTAAVLLAATLSAMTAVWLSRQRRKRNIYQKFESRRDLHDSLAMQVVAGYMLVEPLGSGGMATVYRGLPAADLDESKAVALKVLGREMVDDAEFRERFRREVNAYRKLSHPNIVRIHDWGEMETGLIYIVLELIQGQTLRSHMNRGSLSAARICAVLEAFSSALDHAHTRGIVHRDLKPENLMLTDSGELRVMDFGLARHEGADRLTRTDVVMGTPAYMAPEQLGGGEVDAKLDQYALGVICYELLCGQLPYNNTSGMGLFSDIVSCPPVPIRQRKNGLSAELETALNKMLSKKPGDRFASVAEAWQALKPHLGAAR